MPAPRLRLVGAFDGSPADWNALFGDRPPPRHGVALRCSAQPRAVERRSEPLGAARCSQSALTVPSRCWGSRRISFGVMLRVKGLRAIASRESDADAQTGT